MNNRENLTENQKQRIQNINYVVASVAVVGSIVGVIHAKRTGGGFWRYVGWWIAGGAIAGLPAKVVALPFENKIIKETRDETKN